MNTETSETTHATFSDNESTTPAEVSYQPTSAADANVALNDLPPSGEVQGGRMIGKPQHIVNC